MLRAQKFGLSLLALVALGHAGSLEAGSQLRGSAGAEAAGQATDPSVEEQPQVASVDHANMTANASDEVQQLSAVDSVVGAAQCTEADGAAMERYGAGNRRGSFGSEVADCGKNSRTGWFGTGFSESKMQSCVGSLGLTSSCAGCFANAGRYGFGNCKFACLIGGSWCSSRCLNCMDGAKTEQCTGIKVPDVSSC